MTIPNVIDWTLTHWCNWLIAMVTFFILLAFFTAAIKVIIEFKIRMQHHYASVYAEVMRLKDEEKKQLLTDSK